jgi:hypothetical protein
LYRVFGEKIPTPALPIAMGREMDADYLILQPFLPHWMGEDVCAADRRGNIQDTVQLPMRDRRGLV